MRRVIYVAPFFGKATLQFIRALGRLKNVQLGLISQAPIELLPASMRAKISGHYRISDGLDAAQITAAARRIGGHLGGIDRLIATLEHIQEQVAHARVVLGLPGMTPEITRRFRDKALMKATLRAAGLPCARHRRLSAPEDARAFAKEVGFPLIVKPLDAAGSIGTFRANNLDELEICLQKMPPTPENPRIAEEFIQGVESSFETVMINGEPVWHSGVYYRPGCLNVIENSWIQWSILLPKEPMSPHFESFRETNIAALRALGMSHGISHMEWFQRADGSAAISEVGARPPGAQIIPALNVAHDTNMFHHWAELVVWDRFSPPPRKYAVAVAFLRAQGAGKTIHSIEGLETVQQELGHLIARAEIPHKGQHPSSSYEGDGFIILRHESMEVVEKAVDRVTQLIRVRLK